ncbi:MAG: hypothetical protein H6695_18010 [Deferribacteres bacterium]|nr:hypothetical protein [candidate division KSB1 bacterium]MCB9512079.1 hypothetical protein [Deferribacteres bacterium]
MTFTIHRETLATGWKNRQLQAQKGWTAGIVQERNSYPVDLSTNVLSKLHLWKEHL